ncbi:hypothetical protein [Amycolatopsis coloradensis]|uniref:hypothetical protein n=1 Tax=Amycolatopsis coloradensis TaxID=76021 RepID=UPI0013012AF0|nr:hypothetical protein [Amycolatopsis coloradensis]
MNKSTATTTAGNTSAVARATIRGVRLMAITLPRLPLISRNQHEETFVLEAPSACL